MQKIAQINISVNLEKGLQETNWTYNFECEKVTTSTFALLNAALEHAKQKVMKNYIECCEGFEAEFDDEKDIQD